MTVHAVFGRHSQLDRRTTLRAAAFADAAVLAVLYLVLFFAVMDAEAGLGENTFGGYLFLAVGYAGLTLLVALRDRRSTYVGGAALQILVVTLFALFGIGVFGPGVFEYDAVASLHMAWWAGFTGALEIALFALCAGLVRGSEA